MPLSSRLVCGSFLALGPLSYGDGSEVAMLAKANHAYYCCISMGIANLVNNIFMKDPAEAGLDIQNCNKGYLFSDCVIWGSLIIAAMQVLYMFVVTLLWLWV